MISDHVSMFQCRMLQCRILQCGISMLQCGISMLQCGISMQWRSDDFRAPRKLLVWASGQEVTATTSFWRAPGPFSLAGPPRSRGLRGPRYATVSMLRCGISMLQWGISMLQCGISMLQCGISMLQCGISVMDFPFLFQLLRF